MNALVALGALLAANTAAEPSRPVIELAEVTGSIDPGSAAHLIEAIRGAQARGVEALVVRLDTPGGLLSSTRDIVQEELSARVPIVFWVGPPGARAGSAGVFLTLAAHVAAMAPSTNIGAAHPVGIGGSDPDGEKDEKDGKQRGPGVMLKKIENDTAAFVQGIAERRSRNVEWAIKSVRESVSVTASKALELKVIDLIAEDLPALLRELDGRKVQLAKGESRVLRTAGAEIRPVKWAVRDQVLHGIADPQIAYLIAMLGVLGILAELYHPGAIVPGVVGGICILIAAVAFQMLPVRIGAVALIGVAVALFVAELKVGGHGGFIAAGAVSLVIGSLLLVGHVSPGFYADADFGLSWKMVAPVGAAFGLIAYGLASKIGRARGHRPLTGGDELVGETGEVKEPVGPDAGLILILGELWKARSAQPLPVGAKARVLAVRGLRLEVAPAGEVAAPPALGS
jgi:membrane-bound serine protease (ClpP class)